jgi:AcrR family transcriptional regulator
VSTQKRKYEKRARADAEAATRAKIAAAAAALHEERGIAGTSVADIARRAGVQRVTVYNHFPDLASLLPACTAHWLVENPLPPMDPADGLEPTLTALYGWYRQTAVMQRRTHGERASVPELDAWMAESGDQIMAGLAQALGGGPLVALAVDFWTWDRLSREGLSDAEAAALMARVAATRP